MSVPLRIHGSSSRRRRSMCWSSPARRCYSGTSGLLAGDARLILFLAVATLWCVSEGVCSADRHRVSQPILARTTSRRHRRGLALLATFWASLLVEHPPITTLIPATLLGASLMIIGLVFAVRFDPDARSLFPR